MPAYNEEDNIKSVIDDWYPIVKKLGNDSKLIVVNDGSKDKTFEIMQKIVEDKPALIPLTKQNSGHGPTLLYAYRYAINKGADYIFQTDSQREC